ncbi:Carboxypeptidase 2 [Fusarium albosuccineum]|uniref:Carboxypeptidase 2 n=1 Tax=Fusarium albosuccineum TaxID=1237068 RepID=A0A8H4P5F0_9HYPO|nr:Carboxypeptidase 2 [Fusarium albosuccineum]
MSCSTKNNFSRLRALLLCIGSVHAQSGGPRGPATYGWNYSPTSKDNEAVSRNYQDIDIELLSPAFLDPKSVPEGFKNGTAGPTDDDTLDHFLRSIASRNDWFNYQVADFKSEEGRAMPYVFLRSTSQATFNSTDKLRVYLQGAIHGNEPAGDQGIMALLGKMDANQTWTASILEKMDILVLPRYNSDGVHYFQREFASNIDPNREHTKLMNQQTRDIKKLIVPFQPHIVVDMHEYAGHNVFSGRYRHGQDAMIATGRNLNTHPDIRNLTENLFSAGVGEALVRRGMRWEPYVLGDTSDVEGTPIVFEEAVTSPTSGRNAFGLTQAVAILCEIRGQWLADQHFQRRTAAALTMLEAVLDIAVENTEKVLKTIEDAIENFIQSDDDIILTDYQESINRTYTLVDIKNGSIVQVPVEFKHSVPAVANLTRSRPEAYLIPRNLAPVVERLSLSGVEVETLRYEYRGTVQAYNVTSAKLDDSFYEGVVRNRVTTEPFEKELVMPAGSFRVSARQKNAAMAFVTLEPESDVSFVTFGLIHLEEAWEYPIFREVA